MFKQFYNEIQLYLGTTKLRLLHYGNNAKTAIYESKKEVKMSCQHLDY